jgi:hypothetical protein
MALEFEQRFPDDLPSSLPVYRLRPAPAFPAATETLARLARGLGLEGRAQETSFSEDWTTHQEGPYDLSIHGRSGAVSYRHREKYQKQGERAFDPAAHDVEGIAGRFLETSGIIASADARMLRVTHLRTAGGNPENGERSEETLLDAGVVYGRTVEGTPVHGPGGTAMVNIDPEAEVVGFRSIWRPLGDAVHDAEIRPPDNAYRALERIAGTVRGDVTVTKAMFGYFEQGVHERQEFLQPAYCLVYVVRDGEVAFKSAEVTAAAGRAFEPLMGAKRFPTPAQPPRKR